MDLGVILPCYVVPVRRWIEFLTLDTLQQNADGCDVINTLMKYGNILSHPQLLSPDISAHLSISALLPRV